MSAGGGRVERLSRVESARFDAVIRARGQLVKRGLCGWSVNPYLLCDHRCTYCVTGVRGSSEPVCPPDRIAEELRRELEAVPAGDTVSFGGISDAYPRVEEKLGIARSLLPVLLQRSGALIVVTKGRAVLRDIDLLRGHSTVTVAVSIGCLDDSKAVRLEPFAPPPSERLAMVNTLGAAGIDVEIQACPWIPGVSDLSALLRRVGEAVRVTVAPLNVEFRELDGRRFGSAAQQQEIDAAYLAEVVRVGTPDNVQWLHPPSTAPEHCLAPLSAGRLHRERLEARVIELWRTAQLASLLPTRGSAQTQRSLP